MNDLVSIAIALYNRETYIRDTLKSLQNQTYKNFECIIVDDHSTDNSVSGDPNFYELNDKVSYLLASFKEQAFIKTN